LDTVEADPVGDTADEPTCDADGLEDPQPLIPKEIPTAATATSTAAPREIQLFLFIPCFQTLLSDQGAVRTDADARW
jgi:hypothetical protein